MDSFDLNLNLDSIDVVSLSDSNAYISQSGGFNEMWRNVSSLLNQGVAWAQENPEVVAVVALAVYFWWSRRQQSSTQETEEEQA